MIAILAVLLLLLLMARETGPWSGEAGAARSDPARPLGEGDPDSGPGDVGTWGRGAHRDDADHLDGIVVDVGGVPVAGATVTYEPEADEPPARPEATAMTDEQGRFALPVCRLESMMLVARHPDYRLSQHFVHPDEAEPVRIVIERGASLKVVVHGPDGVVAGAAVEATAKANSREDPGYRYTVDVDDAVTGEDGEASLGRVPVGWIHIGARKQGLAAERMWFEIPDTTARTVEITLSRGGTIEGKVTAPDGTPIQGARLHDRGRKEVLATTDAFGRYRIAAIDQSGIRAVADADGYGPGSFGEGLGWSEPIHVHVAPDEVVRDVDIVLGPASYVRGRVVDRQGHPVAGVTVSIEVEKGVVHSDTAITGDDGSFVVGPVSAREGTTFSLEFEGKNLAFFTIHNTWKRSLARGRDDDVGEVTASVKAAIAGKVFDIDGSPLKNGYVSTGAAEAPVRDGVFLLEGVHRIEQEIVAYGFGPALPRSYPVKISPGAGQRVEVELHLVETLAVSGRVVNANGEPLESIWLRAIPKDSEEPDQLGVIDATGKDGRFELPGLLPGEYRVGIKRDVGFGFDFAHPPEPRLVVAGVRDLVFEMPVRGGRLKGKVVARGSRLPVRAFGVNLYERIVILPKYKDYWNFENDTGAFVVETPEPGIYCVDVCAENYAEHRTEWVKVEPGGTVDLGTIALGDPGSVYGRVQDHSGQPIAWCRIYLLSSKLKLNFDPPLTDAEGRYDVQGLSPGSYTLFALSPRHPLAIRRGIEVGEDIRRRVNVDTVAAAPLVLRVLDEQGEPIPDAQLVWTFPDLAPFDSSTIGKLEPSSFGSNTAGSDGVIRKPFLPEGGVEIRVEAEGYAAARRRIALRAGESQDVEIRLQKR